MAGTRTKQAPPSVRADYLRGDPSQEGPITRGRLELEASELHFHAPGGADLKIALRDMEGLTVSGRSPYEHPRKSVRGTMFVAARSNGAVDVWEFAVERDAGATLRDRINRELYERRLRRPPLPFVEQLVGPIAPLEGAPPAAANGHPSDERERTLLRPRFVLLALAIAAVILAEILIALSLFA